MNEQQLAGLGALVSITVGTLARYRRDLPYLWRRETDWNALREALGCEAAPDRPVHELPMPRQRRLLGFWPLATDWDWVRREYGYGVTVEGQFRVLSEQPPHQS